MTHEVCDIRIEQGGWNHLEEQKVSVQGQQEPDSETLDYLKEEAASAGGPVGGRWEETEGGAAWGGAATPTGGKASVGCGPSRPPCPGDPCYKMGAKPGAVNHPDQPPSGSGLSKGGANMQPPTQDGQWAGVS